MELLAKLSEIPAKDAIFFVALAGIAALGVIMDYKNKATAVKNYNPTEVEDSPPSLEGPKYEAMQQ